MRSKRLYKYFKFKGFKTTVFKVIKRVKRVDNNFSLIVICSDIQWPDDPACPYKDCPYNSFCSKFGNKVNCIHFFGLDNFFNETIKSNKLEYLLKGGVE